MEKKSIRVLIAICVIGLVVSGCSCVKSRQTKTEAVHMANGIKIGEVDSTSAIVWARLTKHPERNIKGMPFPNRKNPLDSENRGEYVYDLEKMEAAVPGVKGQVRLFYWPTGSKKQKKLTAWQWVLQDKDFTRQTKLEGLLPGTKYSITAEGRSSQNDNHANKGFTHEGDQLRKFIGKQKNMFVVCGDRHWQYVSVDPATGTKEYSCGPTSDKHAGGFNEEQRSPKHRYLKIKGGFLSVTVERVNDKPTIFFRHHGVDGSVYNEDIVTQK